MKGTIKRFFFRKGFGFIEGDDGTEYFFHYSDYDGDKRDLRPGVAVDFDPSLGDKGPCAVAIGTAGGSRREPTKPQSKPASQVAASPRPGGGGAQFVFGLVTGCIIGAVAVALSAGLI